MTSNGSTPQRDAASPAAPVPGMPLRAVPPETRLTAMARLWARVVARSSFVPQGRATARAVLADALRAIVDALTEEPFDPGRGRTIGRTLVAKHISSPKALGDSIDLLGGRLLEELGISDEQAPRRLAALLGQVATGYTESLRDAALLAAEDINRAERTAWRDQQRKLHRRLQHALLHDRLTDLPNRAQFTGWLAETLARAPSDARLGLCLVNLDRFKAINDSIGMEKADQVLLAVASRLSAQASRYGHFLAHLGADTFAIGVARTNDSDDVAKVADRALRTLADPIRLDGLQIPITASAGIVERAVAGAHATELIRAADISVGWAKTDQGRYRQGGRWALFDERRNAVEVRRHTLTGQIPGALARGEFTLAYQPLVRLADRKLVGVEALARWDHPEHGLISPGQFIPSAEDTGLIVPLGLALLEKACAQAAAWRSATGHELIMSVNLAVAQIRAPGLLAAITDVLRRTGWPAELLQLEITESALIGTDDDAMDIVHELADLGIALSIDDFGTGYSSLAYLSELPVRNLKLAASFLRGLDTDTPTAKSNLTILPALIKLSHDLAVTVTAEGIEAVDQADHLNGLGCDFGQGYHLGRPMPAADIGGLLAGS